MNIYDKLLKKPISYLVLTAGLGLLSSTAFASLADCSSYISGYPGNKTTLTSASTTDVSTLNACVAQNYCGTSQNTDIYCGSKLAQLDFAANLSANATGANP